MIAEVIYSQLDMLVLMIILQVPTICIENVFVWNNTTVLVDEVLSHRIGLVPLNVDPSLIDMRGPNDQPTDRNTLIFQINHECTRNFKAPKDSTDPNELYFNSELKSSDIVWQPAGLQDEVFATKPAPTNKDIVLAKLRPGQQVNMELHAVKGVGKDHAKFSPVGGCFPVLSKLDLLSHSFTATASYRLLPHVKITKPIPSVQAEKFQKCFSPGVIHIDPRTKEVSVDENGARKDLVSREVLRHPEFADSVELSRVKDFFLCGS